MRYKTRFNPFNRSYEVVETNPEGQVVQVLHKFEEQHDALSCKKSMEHHYKLFGDEELDEVA